MTAKRRRARERTRGSTDRPHQARPATEAAPRRPLPAAPPGPLQRRRSSFWRGLAAVVIVGGISTTATLAYVMRGEEAPFRLELGVPTEVSAAQVKEFASAARPVYWVGPPQAGSLELTRTARGAIYVRYLPAGVELGDRSADFTTIATYSVPDAYAFVNRAVRGRGARHARSKNGAIVAWRQSKPTSVYYALPGTDYLVEVYDSSPRRARGIALRGRLRPAS